MQSTPSEQSTQVEQRTPRIHQLDNGMVLVGEPTGSVQSAALTLLVPCGTSQELADRQGISSVLCDMVLRGAGARDGRQLINDLEVLGVDRGESVGSSQTSFCAATLADNLDEAITIYADILRRPVLPKEHLEAAKQICFHELRAIEDDPAQKLMVELRLRAYPEPWGRNSSGDYTGISATTHEDVVDHWACHFRPDKAILGVAGNFQWQPLVDRIEKLFGDWKGPPLPILAPSNQSERPPHIDHQSNQCHIGIAFPSVPYRHPDYLQAWAAIGILSSGMSSRLFTEVRERRGLCYTVYASLHTQLERASVFCYAGTTAERAQETLDVTFAELQRLGEGIKSSELERLKARIKSSLIMQQESTNARSGSIARDWFHLGRIRTLEEVGRLVDELTSDSINAYLAKQPPSDFTFTTIGPQSLEFPVGEA
jgi:predicted Zn-dependent peptidase